jgi:hypothetical protein
VQLHGHGYTALFYLGFLEKRAFDIVPSGVVWQMIVERDKSHMRIFLKQDVMLVYQDQEQKDVSSYDNEMSSMCIC